MGAICALLPVESNRIEILPQGTTPFDVLQGSVHSLSLKSGCTLHWSSSSYHLTEVNDLGTSLARQLVKGDACLVGDSLQLQLNELMHSRCFKTSQPAEPKAPSAGSSASRHHSQEQQQEWYHNSSHAAVKRTRSMQHIAAANSTRQRILSSIGCARGYGEASEAPAVATPPPPAGCSSSTIGRTSSNGGAAPALHGQDSSAHSAHALPPIRTSSCNVAGRQGSSSNSGSEQLQLPFSHLQCSSSAAGKHLPLHPSSTNNNLYNNASSSSAYRTPSCCSSINNHQAASSVSGLCSPRSRGSTHQTPSTSCSPASCVSCGSAGKFFHHQSAADTCEQQQCSEVQQLRAGSSSDACCSPPAWEDLSVEIVGRVAAFMGDTVTAVMPIYLTCRSWRRAVLDDDQLLMGLAFRLNTAAPFKQLATTHQGRATSPPAAATVRRHVRHRHPALLERAAKLGNVSALVVRARLLDAAGCPDEGMRCWRRAAKSGHLEAQLVFGLGLYRGAGGLAQDAEDAHLWLIKAVKQVLPKRDTSPLTPTSTCNSSAGTCSTSTAPQPAAAAAGPAPAALPSAELVGRVLAQAGLVLGYLCFDGEGTRIDKQEAVKYFKLAAGAGSKEAEQVLGWMYNTGQY